MIQARFRMQLPTDAWIAAVSSSHPSATFRLLTGAPLEDRALELGEITGPDPDAAAGAVETHPDIVAFEEVHSDDHRIIARYEAVERRLYEFLGDTSLPPEFPVRIQNGSMEFDVTVTRPQFDALGETLAESDYRYELLSVVEGRDPETLLTERQRECLAIALREGYFDVPRSSTLADVADAIGVDKSTASETIRRGSARVLEWFLVGDDPI